MSIESIHDLEDSFSDITLCLSINRPYACFFQEMYVFTFLRKRGVICSVDFTYTRSLLDIGTWNVPSRFLSCAPTFFHCGMIVKHFHKKYVLILTFNVHKVILLGKKTK